MNKRSTLQSVFEQRPQVKSLPRATPNDMIQMNKESKLLLLAVVMGALFMVACLYVVYFQGWSKHIVTFVSPLGVAVPCARYMTSLSGKDGETVRARASSLALGATAGYVGGLILTAIFVLAWNVVE